MWGGDAVYVDNFEAIWLGDNQGYRPLKEVKEEYENVRKSYPFYQEMLNAGT